LALAEEDADVVISYAAAADKAADIVRKIEAKGVRGFAIRADQGNVSEAKGWLLRWSKVRQAEHFGQQRGSLRYGSRRWRCKRGCHRTPEQDQCGWRVRNDSGCGEGSARSWTNHYHCSTAGTRTGFNGAADYSARKAAVGAFNRVAARDLLHAHHGKYSAGGFCGYGYESREQRLGSGLDWRQCRSGDMVAPRKSLAGVVFLASPEASYVTGTLLNIDGGLLA